MNGLISLEYVNARGEQLRVTVAYSIGTRLLEILTMFGRFM
ncbi:hypothetical protein N183_15460 [Sinorhizobium sp. Sb3]|nr:hypothetical protein [Sinorhizobium sp. Sb3]KSV81910.1 hypothetical protein N183_15460 [Sinorhizobium sp. Sb3]